MTVLVRSAVSADINKGRYWRQKMSWEDGVYTKEGLLMSTAEKLHPVRC